MDRTEKPESAAGELPPVRMTLRDGRSVTVRAVVLAENRSMLDLARRLGFEVGASGEGPSVKLVRLDLGSTARN